MNTCLWCGDDVRGQHNGDQCFDAMRRQVNAARAEAEQSKSLANTALRQGMQDRRDLQAARAEVEELKARLSIVEERHRSAVEERQQRERQIDQLRAEALALKELVRDVPECLCVRSDRPAKTMEKGRSLLQRIEVQLREGVDGSE